MSGEEIHAYQLNSALLRCDEGKILIDDIDIKTYKVRSLRDKIGIVLQDTVLFSDTVKNNILLGKPGATDEEIIAAQKPQMPTILL